MACCLKAPSHYLNHKVIYSVCWRIGVWDLGFESCIQQWKTTCLLPIQISLTCARASKLTTTNMCFCSIRMWEISHKWLKISVLQTSIKITLLKLPLRLPGFNVLIWGEGACHCLNSTLSKPFLSSLIPCPVACMWPMAVYGMKPISAPQSCGALEQTLKLQVIAADSHSCYFCSPWHRKSFNSLHDEII